MVVPSLEKINEHPYGSLTITFLLWKALGLILALLSPGPGYDTSTDLLFQFDTGPSHDHTHAERMVQSFVQRLCLKLVRWDAIYFVSGAKHGYVYEQQWAFSWVFANLIKTTTKCED